MSLYSDDEGFRFPIFCTHLDVHDESGLTRRRQVEEIMKVAEEREVGGHMIAGDFNSVRKRDYDSVIWSIMEQQNADRGLGLVVTQVAEALDGRGYDDAFDILGLDPPTATVWSLRRVDFLMLSAHWKEGTLQKGNGHEIRLTGAYVLHVDHSDHIPLVTDFTFS